jgi:pimeloyl-ACP methyl ester carboxylesterase
VPSRSVRVLVDVLGGSLPGDLVRPPQSDGLILFAHGSGSGRASPRNRAVAATLNAAGLGTLLFDLLTPDEALDRRNVFDIPLLGSRLSAAAAWIRDHLGDPGLPIGYFGASTGAGAALWAAAEPDDPVRAVVSRGGRPDLAGDRLGRVRAPTLLIIGGADPVVLGLNEQALAVMRCPAELVVVPGATHLFEEPGALERVAALASDWFGSHLRDRT